MIGRRQFLALTALGGGALWIGPHMALASADTDRRFVFLIQRGAADGLDIVRPMGDPAFAGLRETLVREDAALPLDGMFHLHPALAEVGAMYRRGEALFVHAVASPYRDRSHFDGQNVLETGGLRPQELRDGWLNRLVALMPQTGEPAIAFAPTVPQALRGDAPVTSYAPSSLPDARDDLLRRVSTLYDRDPELHALWAEAMRAEELAEGIEERANPEGVGRLAATFLARADGPRIAMIETGGWDTHAQQAQRIEKQLGGVDALLAAFRAGMGEAWAKTTVLVATEFGRTARVNGTGGTDHGTAAVAMLVGGAVRGGRVIADWPGLSPQNLYDERDLRPTAGLDGLIAGVAGEALGLDPALLAQRLFAAPVAGAPVTGLIRG